MWSPQDATQEVVWQGSTPSGSVCPREDLQDELAASSLALYMSPWSPDFSINENKKASSTLKAKA